MTPKLAEWPRKCDAMESCYRSTGSDTVNPATSRK